MKKQQVTYRSLDETEWSLQHGLDCRQLRVVQVRQSRHRKLARQRRLELLALYLMTQQTMIQVTGHRGVVHREGLQRILHAVVAGCLPDKLGNVALGDVVWDGVATHLQRNFAVVNAHHVSGALPGPTVQSCGSSIEAKL